MKKLIGIDSFPMIKIERYITEEFIEEIKRRLSENKQVRRKLPGPGRLHIDRQLPFLCIYRRPVKDMDQGTDQLVKGEASYLLASSASRHRTELASLVRGVIETLSDDPKAFLIIEIWSGRKPLEIIDPETGKRTAPAFSILIQHSRIPLEAVESLKKELSQITVSRNRGKATIGYTSRPWPANLPPVISTADLTRYNCFLIGIEILPIYRDPDSGEIFPFVLRKIHRGLSTALKRAAFEFTRNRTTVRPASYMSLGRKAVVKALWEVDQKLAEISNQIDFLLLVTPVNIEQSLHKFSASRFEKEPVFYYRPIPVDPSVLKRSLYNIPFDRIEDPVLASIFHRKLVELEIKLSMLRDRKTKNFLYGSMQLYGELDNNYTALADDLLETISPRSHELKGGHKLNAREFADMARQELKFFETTFPEISSVVHIRDDITGLMVLNGNLMIGNRVRIPESRAAALIQHEVGTHILTYLNGKAQPFQQLYCGLAGCDELQEGVAVLSEYLAGGLSPPRLRLLAGRVKAARMLTDGASFVETFRELHLGKGFSQRTAYIITSRIYRSGGFTKDAVYLRGLLSVAKYLREGGELPPLLVGKISIEDVPLIRELQLRKVLKPIMLFPRYLSSRSSLSRLNDLRNGTKILKLI
jgi:uncharacterized protein (TIGR02421 family)